MNPPLAAGDIVNGLRANSVTSTEGGNVVSAQGPEKAPIFRE